MVRYNGSHPDALLTCVCVCDSACAPLKAEWTEDLARSLGVGERLAPTAPRKNVDPTLSFGRGAAAGGRRQWSNSPCQEV